LSSESSDKDGEEILVKNGNKDLSEMEIHYKNFNFYAIPAKRSEGLLFTELNDRL